jgi:hypothetical protein
LLRGEGIAQFHIVGPVAGAIGIAGGVRIGRARIEGQLRYVPPHELREREQSPSAMVQAVTFGVAGCFEPVWRRLTFPLCGSIHAGGLRGRGRDRVEESVVAWEPWVSGAATAGLRVEVASRVALLLRGGPEVVFLQRRFVVGPQAEPVYDPQRVAGQVALGIEFAFSSRKRPPIPTKR